MSKFRSENFFHKSLSLWQDSYHLSAMALTYHSVFNGKTFIVWCLYVKLNIKTLNYGEIDYVNYINLFAEKKTGLMNCRFTNYRWNKRKSTLICPWSRHFYKCWVTLSGYNQPRFWFLLKLNIQSSLTGCPHPSRGSREEVEGLLGASCRQPDELLSQLMRAAVVAATSPGPNQLSVSLHVCVCVLAFLTSGNAWEILPSGGSLAPKP